MTENLPPMLNRPLEGLSRLPANRQFGTILGLAVVLAVGATIVMWGMRPQYQPLLADLDGRDISEAMNVLDAHGIPFEHDPAAGGLTVPAARAAEARLHLATEGLPRTGEAGFELLDEDTGLGTSRMMEDARYQRALEGELARSVTTLDAVHSARVHLALPRQSVFVRERSEPAASVLVELHRGRALSDTQTAGIAHMVASSVPELSVERVTVVDQRGELISRTGEDSAAGLSNRHLEYTRSVEEAFRQRVEDILAPLVGPDRMRVQVTADVDFTQVESTREIYDPDATALRSEQLTEEESFNELGGGVPGALTNQPPGGAQAQAIGEEAAAGAAAGEEELEEVVPGSTSRRSTRNFEVDRTISHIREAPASLSRLSVAVVVDDREVAGEGGGVVRAEREPQEMEYLSTLVREAVGFDEARGDRVNVINASFREVEAPEAIPELPPWEQPWARELMRQGLAGLGLLLLALLVLRPALRALTRPPPGAQNVPALAGAGAGAAAGLPGPEPGSSQTSSAPEEPPERNESLAAGRRDLDDELTRARRMADEDPRLVAQVVKQWVNEDAK